MTGNFNIREYNWNPSYPHHSMYTDTLSEIANSFNLELLILIIQVPTRYTDNPQEPNLVIDLMFLCANIEEFNKHTILPDLCSSSNHASLSINIIIEKKSIQDKRQTIVKNSIKEGEFVNKLKNKVEYVIRRVCGQTWTRVRVWTSIYYSDNY